MKSPFKFLDPYTAKDKRVFFGRERETEELYQKLMMTSLLLVYGLSGTGKTSLVRCGLARRFRGPDWYPLYIRRGEDINQAVHQVLKEKAGAVDGDHYRADLEKAYAQLGGGGGKAIAQIAEPQRALSGNLAAAIDRLYAKHLRPIYLIFDQFEEIFTLGSEDEQRVFAENLRDLIHADLPCKIILVMREEYIGYLYYLEEVLPEINDFRIRVEAMEDKRVAEVIQKSCAAFNVTLKDAGEIPTQIIDKLRGEENGDGGPRSRIQLPYLQVYLDGLYQHVLKETHPATSKLEELPQPLPKMTFNSEQVEAYGSIENVLGDFLESQTKRIQAAVKTAFPLSPKDSVKEVLDQFVTVDGTKRPLYKGDISVSNLKPEIIAMIVEELLEARILRPDGDRFELAHDALAFRISAGRSDEERRFKEIVEFLKTKYEQFKRKLTGHLTAHEVALVRSHPKPRQIEEKLSRSEWQYFRGSENRVLVRRFSWFLGLFLLLLIIIIGEGIIIFNKNRTIAKLDSLTGKNYELSDKLSFGGLQVERSTMIRLDSLIKRDSFPEATQVITAILDTLGNRSNQPPETSREPPTPEPGALPCDELVLMVQDALSSLDDEAWTTDSCRTVFGEFRSAYQEGRCGSVADAEEWHAEIEARANTLLDEAIVLDYASDTIPEEAMIRYQKAGCLLNVDVQELIEGE